MLTTAAQPRRGTGGGGGGAPGAGEPGGRRGGRGGRGRGGGTGGGGTGGGGAASAERAPRADGRRPRHDDRPPGFRQRGPSVAAGQEVRVPGAPDDLPSAPKRDADDQLDLAGSTLRDILMLLGLTATEISAREPETAGDGIGMITQVFDVYGEDDETADELGVLIGRRGETLGNLQYLLNTIVSRQEKDGPIFGIDVEGYRRRREQQLVDMAKEIAAEVRATGDVITLEPMPAAERRIIHLCLQDEEGVRTESVGSGSRRQIEIMPA